MGYELPADAPKSSGEAFAFINRLKDGATAEDLPVLALVEAIGKALYDEMAGRADHPEVKKLLLANGREELAHAHRVSKAFTILTGETFAIPPIDQIPFYTPMEPMPITKASLSKLAEGEFGGGDLYDGIAASFDNPEAIALFRQNGKEELEHGDRMMKAVAFLSE
jgi:rubrerythrin